MSLHPHRVALVLLLTASAAWASAENPFFEPLPVVLSASRLAQPLQDSPGAVSVIDADLIAATGYRELARVLRLVPGFQVGQERGNVQWVTYHGLGMDYPVQMQLLVDGRASLTPSFAASAERALPGDIERIEVVRGSNSAAYGSNAFLGVVNITTDDASRTPGTRLKLAAGAPGILDAGVRHAAQAGPLSLRIGAHHEEDDGFDDLYDGRRTDVLNLRADLRVDATNELGLIAGVAESTHQLGYAGSIFGTAAEREGHKHNRSLHLRWRHTPHEDEEWLLSAYWSGQQMRERWRLDSALNPPPGFQPPPQLGRVQATVGNDAQYTQHNLELEHRLRVSADTRLMWGAEWQRTQDESAFFYHASGRHARNEHRLFSNLEWRAAPAWLWNLGGMIEQLQGDEARFAPRVFLNWQATPRFTWRIGHSRAWRQPVLFERNADVRVIDDLGRPLQYRQLPNPALRPQRIDASEIGFLGVFGDSRSTLDVRLFRERIDDVIVRSPVPAGQVPPSLFSAMFGSTRWENHAGRVQLNGIETQLHLKPWRGTEFILSHSLIDRDIDDPRIRRNVAPYSASLSWLQRAGAWRSMLSVLRMGPIDAGFSYVPGYNYTVPSYTTLDWSIARSLRVLDQAVEVRLTGINLLGRHQELANRPLQAQAEFAGRPASQVSRQVWMALETTF
ncbi:MAG: TonB-dependent receptor [Thauera sp.]|uniref:TonB-dependent receptor plug domain-containing protein n=1 Tax=Thauera sp. TaxID=1905334 RepID=UPI0026349279|nr:TonB-dependent receptor [Thauera sp.]MCP5225765.1 TonB-dependent receptor [Thauera sp.]